MGLYLAVFASSEIDEELDGVDVGGYDDFNLFRKAVAEHLGQTNVAKRLSQLMLHSDSDGTWSVEDLPVLRREILAVREKLQSIAPVAVAAGWQSRVAEDLGLKLKTANDCYFDVDGIPLTDAFLRLIARAMNVKQPIWFQ